MHTARKIESWRNLATVHSKGKATWKESDRHAKRWKCCKAERGASAHALAALGRTKQQLPQGPDWSHIKLLLQSTISLVCSEGLCEDGSACVWLRRVEIRAVPRINRGLFAGAGIKVVWGMESVFVCDAAVPELHRMLT